jgi:hypothetical protein
MPATEGVSPRKYFSGRWVLKDSLSVAGGQAGVLLAIFLPAQPPARLPAQVVPNRAALYLHPTDVADARAVWVNPAGLAVLRHASVHVDLTVREPGPAGRLRQVTAGFSSRGLGFSYQRDLFEGGFRAHTYRVGLAGAAGGFAAGGAIVVHRGDTRATGWDIGAVYTLRPSVTLGGLIANIGEPDVRGITLPLTATPGVTVAPLGPSLVLSAHALVTRDSVLGSALGIRWSAGTRVPIGLLARLDTDRKLHSVAFAFGLSVGRQDMIGTVITTPGDVRAADAASLYGVVSRPLGR